MRRVKVEEMCQGGRDISNGSSNKVDSLAGGPREVGQKSSGSGELEVQSWGVGERRSIYTHQGKAKRSPRFLHGAFARRRAFSRATFIVPS
jgi:hypothetical protein